MGRLRQYFLASASSAAMVGGAQAADLPYPVKAPPKPVAVWSWAGPYIGLNVGWGENNAKFDDELQFAFFQPASRPFWKAHASGATIGGQIGYNWQSQNIVYGVEADVNWIDGKASALFPPGLPNIIGQNISASTKLDWFATFRGRLGVAITPPTLLYVTGGAAVADIRNAWGRTAVGGTDFVNSQTRAGYVVGGGIEHMFSPKWTARVEALYADFGSDSTTVSISGFGTYTSRFTNTLTVVRGAVNYKW
jgi:outer membrane immunogenic protein